MNTPRPMLNHIPYSTFSDIMQNKKREPEDPRFSIQINNYTILL